MSGVRIECWPILRAHIEVEQAHVCMDIQVGEGRSKYGKRWGAGTHKQADGNVLGGRVGGASGNAVKLERSLERLPRLEYSVTNDMSKWMISEAF